MQDLGRDLRFAFRTIAREPAHALAVIATLAIGIGANTAIFSVFNWILFRPLPGISRPGELVTIRYHAGSVRGSYFIAYRDYADLRDNARQTLAGVSASTPVSASFASISSRGWCAYTPASDPTWGTIQVPSALPPAQAIAAIRDVARGSDPVVAPHDVETFESSVDRALTEQRLFARVSGIFAAVGALLAAIGIYGMMAAAIAERRKEFGIRLALGASTRAVVRMVLRAAFTRAAVGLLFGVAAAAAARRLFEARLYGVSGFDPVAVAAAITCILVLSVAASLVPALRASRVDPVRSLRTE